MSNADRPTIYLALPQSIPSPSAAQVWLDFDGTLSRQDVLDELIARFAADDSWKRVEEQWRAGTIGSYECLRQEFDLLRVTQPRLREFLQTVALDPGARELVALLRRRRVPFAILSDGIDLFIRQALRAAGIARVPTRANTITHEGDRIALVCPHRSPTCESAAAHCKCASAALLHQPPRQTIYVGDGRSDLCPARKASIVFAKGALARALSVERRAFIPFDTLVDVSGTLRAAWRGTRSASRRSLLETSR